MKALKFLLALLANAMLAVTLGTGFSMAATEAGVLVDAVTASGVILGAGLAYNAVVLFAPSFSLNGLSLMPVQVEIWETTIMQNLFKDNAFLNYSVDVSSQVLSGKVVHIPQAGTAAPVEKNRSVYPAVAVQRGDTDVTYNLDHFSTDPIHIPNIEQAEISYDKRQSVYKDKMGNINDAVADELLYKWSTGVSANIIRTTGSLVSTNLAPSATGTRRKLTKEDLVKARGILTKSKVKGTFVAVVPTDMFQELLEDSVFTQSNVHIQNASDPTSARIIRWGNMNIVERTDTTIYNSSLAPKAPGASGASGDHQAVICWVDSAVERAVGTVKFFENIQDATYYGDVYSCEVRAGGRIRREDGKGMCAIVQAAS